MRCLLYIPTGTICKFFYGVYTLSIDKYITRFGIKSSEDLIFSICDNPGNCWGSFRVRNSLPQQLYQTEFEIIEVNNNDENFR